MKSYLALPFLFLFAVACTPTVKDNGDTEKYNQLVQKYNDLLNSSHDLQISSTKEAAKLNDLDNSILKFNEAANLAEKDGTISAYTKFNEVTAETTSILIDLENLMLKQMDTLIKNAKHVYKDETLNVDKLEVQKLRIVLKSNVLVGIRELLAKRIMQVKDGFARTALKPSTSGPSVTTAPPTTPAKVPEIPLTKEERSITEINPGQGFYRDKSGQVRSTKDSAELRREAGRLGLRPEAAGDAFIISSRTGGIVALAGSTQDVSARMLDILGHIKAAMNQNTADLDLILAIDYSGSMSDKIDNVLVNLKSIVASLSNLLSAGRNYRIGITTFGEGGKEKIDLQPTGSAAQVQATLDQLRRDFGRKQHSTDPGEASFAGLNLIAEQVAFTAGNRKVILITDEPSQEIATGRTGYVDGVLTKLKSRGVETTIYTIVVPAH